MNLYPRREDHFHVILHNNSNLSLKIPKESCSEGYYALRFEVADDSGKTWNVRKADREWSWNALEVWLLEPGENLVLDVYYHDANLWPNFPRLYEGDDKPFRGLKPKKFVLRAIFSPPGKDRGAWTGSAASKPETVFLVE